MNLIKKSLLAGVACLILSGCASTPPLYINYTEEGNQNGIVRSFAAFPFYTPYEQGDQTDAMEFAWGFDFEKSGYEPVTGKTLYTHRWQTIAEGLLNPYGNDRPLPYQAASALGVQGGDLLEFLSYDRDLYGFIDGTYLQTLRVVCKFYDEECITRERRDYVCKRGAMVIDGERREDRPCGGAGGDSDDFAFVIGSLEGLYGSLDNYLRQHNSPYDANCLMMEDLSCGDEQGKAIEYGKYDEFLERWPNYLAAQEAAYDFVKERMHEDGHTAERAWAIYLSENMFSPTQVAMSKDEFIEQFNDRNATL